jgi:hypothetical protein
MVIKVFAGAVVAGIVVFFWGAISHMALPLGTMGVKSLPNDDAVMAPLRQSVNEPGFYFFPGHDMSRTLTESEQKAYAEKLRLGPSGVIILQPSGAEAMSPRQLLTELATNIVAALLAAILLTQVHSGFVGRVTFVTLLGLFGFVSISVPYWNWYAFPTNFTVAEGIDQVVGWFLAGLVLAAIVRPRKSVVVAATS